MTKLVEVMKKKVIIKDAEIVKLKTDRERLLTG